MWISLSDSFLSIVAIPAQPENLKVRARRKGDIERVFPDAIVARTPGRDYLYRAEMPRAVVAKVIATRLEGIGYDNFKASVKNSRLHASYMSVWTVMSRLQAVRPYALTRDGEGV